MNIEEIRDYDHYEELKKKSMLLLYFFHPLCTACVDAAPALESLMQKHDWLDWSKILLEKHPDIAAQNMVFIVPTLIIVQGEKELYRQSRIIHIGELDQALQSLKENEKQEDYVRE